MMRHALRPCQLAAGLSRWSSKAFVSTQAVSQSLPNTLPFHEALPTTRAQIDTRIPFVPLSPSIGAQVDLDARDILRGGKAAVDDLHHLLVRRGVLVFKDQRLEPAEHVELARLFGEIEGPHPVYPNIDGVTVIDFQPGSLHEAAEWHADCTWSKTPPFATLLHSQHVPTCGGDTLFASTSAAWSALPQEIQEFLKDKIGVHDFGSFRNRCQDEDSTLKSFLNFGVAMHPVKKVHPATGQPCLYVNEAFTVFLQGMSFPDSARELNHLFAQIRKPEFQYRHRWGKGDLLIWDNRCTQHYAVGDYNEYRKMHRVTVLEDGRSHSS